MVSRHVSHDQTAILAVCAAALALFAFGRWRFDVVGIMALVAAVLLRVVPPESAFAGFADPSVAAVAALLVISAAVRDSGLLDAPRFILTRLPRWTGLEVGIIGGCTAALSALMNNFDAFTSMMPAVRNTVRNSRRSSAPLIAAVGAASLLGGLMTVVGTPTNLLMSSLRRTLFGSGYSVFAFMPAGSVVATAGVLLLALSWRLLPRDQLRERDEEAALPGESFTSEVVVPVGSSLIGQTVAALRVRADRAVVVSAIIREDFRRIVPRHDLEIAAGDVLVLKCEPDALQRLMERAGLLMVGVSAMGLDRERIGVVEAVISPGSELVGVSPRDAGLDERHRVRLLAIGRRSGTIGARLRRTKLRAGDVLVLQGEIETMGPTLSMLGCLTLAERRLRLGQSRRMALPALSLIGAVTLAAWGLVPIGVALLCAVAALVMLRILTMSEVYGSIAWPMVVLFGTMLPVSAALSRSGAADMLAAQLASLLRGAPDGWLVALTLAVSLVATPIVNGAATVLMIGPIAAALASQLGLAVDSFLMAVAIGASCDFVTSIGSRNNILSLGSERSATRPPLRLSLSLTAMVAALGPVAILYFWPVR